MRLGHGSYFPRLREAANPGEIEHDHTGRLLGHHLPKDRPGGHRLTRADRYIGGACELSERIKIVHLDRIFEPEGLERLEGSKDLFDRTRRP